MDKEKENREDYYEFANCYVPSAQMQSVYDDAHSAVFCVEFKTKHQKGTDLYYHVDFEMAAESCHMAVVNLVERSALDFGKLDHLDASIILDFPSVCEIWVKAHDALGALPADEESVGKLSDFISTIKPPKENP